MPSDVIRIFDEFRSIFGICPCCGEVFRLGDASLHAKGKRPSTEFDRLGARAQALDRAEERFDAREAQLREIAQARGRQQARRVLRRIDPVFTGHDFEVQDVKVLFDPVQFVVFRGLNGPRFKEIVFVDGPPRTSTREKTLKSIQTAITRGNCDWLTLRLSEDGRIVRDGQPE